MTPKTFSKILIALILAIIFLSLSTGIFFWNTMTAESKKVKEKELVLNSFTEKKRTLENLKISYEKVKENKDDLYAALPDQKNATVLMTSLANLATSKGVEIVVYDHKMNAKKTPAPTTNNKSATPTPPVNLSLSQTEKEGDLYRLPLDITASGSYVKVLEFLKNLENFDRLIAIDNINIVKDSSSTGDTVKATFSAGAYLKP